MAIYRGKKSYIKQTTRGGSKKSFVYVKAGNKVKKVSFGDPNMKIRKNNKAARKSFLARHNCSNAGPKTKLGTGAAKLGVNLTSTNPLYET